MNLLGIVQEFCRRTALTVPQLVATSNDDQLLQLMGLANEVTEDLVNRREWTLLQREIVFTSVAGEDQGSIQTITNDDGFLHVLNDTIYDRTRRLPVWGPRNAQDWQGLKALPMSGPFYQYRFRGNHLLMLPAMPAGHVMAFEYAAKSPIQDSTTAAYKSLFTKDSDLWLLPDNLLLSGLRWMWKKEKGLPYAEEFRLYEAAVASAGGHDGTKPKLSMSDGSPRIQPGIFVPAGNWNVDNA